MTSIGLRPVEADGGDARADLVGAEQGRQRLRQPAQDGAALAGVRLFAGLDLFPLLVHLGRRVERTAVRIEDVRVAADQLGVNRAQRIGDGELSGVGADLRQEHALEDQVADLSAQRGGVAAIDRVEHLVGFFQQERAQRLDRLLAIPGAALRSAQPRHDVNECLKGRTGVGSHRGRYGTIAWWRTLKNRPPPLPTFSSGSRRWRRCSSATCRIPATGEPVEPNIAAAGHLLEVIAMLQEKTSGNLSPTESKLLDDLLYELRMRFVQAQGEQKRIITP